MTLQAEKNFGNVKKCSDLYVNYIYRIKRLLLNQRNKNYGVFCTISVHLTSNKSPKDRTNNKEIHFWKQKKGRWIEAGVGVFCTSMHQLTNSGSAVWTQHSNELTEAWMHKQTRKQRETHSDADSAQVSSALFRLPSSLCMADVSDEGLPAAPERKSTRVIN